MNKKISNLILSIVVVIIIVIFGLFINWMSERDEKLMVWAEAYEKCVIAEYRTTPMEWYWEHGETYPECDAQPYYAN